MDRLIQESESSRPPEYNNFTLYKKHLYKRYIHTAHLEQLDQALMACTRYAETGGQEGIGFLMVEMPPRHGKTQSISRLYPPWHLGRNPDHRVILASYGATLAKKNSRYTRNLLLSEHYRHIFPGIDLARDSKSAEAWNIAEHEGGLDAMGVGGGVTGKGGHIIIVDDPVKSRDEAESETYRNKVYDWYTDDLYTRREPGAAIIIVMTRWHMDDLIGRLLALEGYRWYRLRLPAYAEPNDPLGRAVGDPLWPERYPLDVLQDIERTLGPYSWSALYQQNPVPSEGGVFRRDWLPTIAVDMVPPIVRAVRYWDLAMSAKTSADFSVGVKLGTGVDGRTYVLDVARTQKEWGDLIPYIAGVALQDGPDVSIGLEEAGYTSRAVQELIADARMHLYGIWGYPVDKDKLTRALPFAARCAAGQVSVVAGHWTQAYLDELCSFNKGAHDDQVDGSSGAWGMLGNGDLSNGYVNEAEQYSISGGAY